MATRQGYLLVDHRASPGLPPEVARWAGYDPRLCGEGKLFEADTLTCAHCKGVVVKNPLRTRDRHICMACGGHYICDGCAYEATMSDYTHSPFEKVADDVIRGAANGITQPLTLTGL